MRQDISPENRKLLERVEKIMRERDAYKQTLQRIKMRENNSHILAAKILNSFAEVV